MPQTILLGLSVGVWVRSFALPDMEEGRTIDGGIGASAEAGADTSPNSDITPVPVAASP